MDYATVDGTALAGSDYTPVPLTTLTFNPGETTKSITVDVLGDTTVELDETFQVLLSNPVGATIADGTGLGTILEDDAATVRINDVSVAEGNSGTSAAVFNVTMSNPSSAPVTMRYGTLPGTATAGSDYTAVTGTLTFDPGITVQSVEVPILGDLTVELNESVLVNLTDLVAGGLAVTVADAQAIGTIINDDAGTVSINDVSVTEGDSGTSAAIFTVTMSRPSSASVTVQFGTAPGTATAGSDYTGAVGSLTFAPGETTKNTTVDVLGDTLFETDETFLVNLTSLSALGRAVTLADNQGQGTILNDDGAQRCLRDRGDTGTIQAIFTVSLTSENDDRSGQRCPAGYGQHGDTT